MGGEKGWRRPLPQPRRSWKSVCVAVAMAVPFIGLRFPGPAIRVPRHVSFLLKGPIVTNTVSTRPLTIGLAIFGAPESGVEWSVISAGTLIAVAPLLAAFLLFQRQFIQSFMQAGIK